MINNIILIGRVGKEPEIRHLETNSVANFTLATTEKWTIKGETQEKTEWHNIVAWKNLADIAEKYIHKGDLVYVDGKMTSRQWKDKDGNTRYSYEVVAENIRNLSGKKQAEPPAGIYEKTGKLDKPIDKEQIQDDTPVDSDGLPF